MRSSGLRRPRRSFLWRSGTPFGKTSSMSCAAVVAILRPRQDGQNPRPLQLNATSLVSSHPSSSFLTNRGSAIASAPSSTAPYSVVLNNLVGRRLLRPSALVDRGGRRHLPDISKPSQGRRPRACNLATLRSASRGPDTSGPGRGQPATGGSAAAPPGVILRLRRPRSHAEHGALHVLWSRSRARSRSEAHRASPGVASRYDAGR